MYFCEAICRLREAIRFTEEAIRLFCKAILKIIENRLENTLRELLSINSLLAVFWKQKVLMTNLVVLQIYLLSFQQDGHLVEII